MTTFRRKFLVWFWGIFSAGLLAAWLVFFMIAKGWLGYLPPLEELQNPQNRFASEVFSSDMQSLGRYYRYENRVSVRYSDLSPHVIHALIATEDARFKNHTGVDFKSFFRALLTLGKAGGGSTLTQQLAKQIWSPRASGCCKSLMNGSSPQNWNVFIPKMRFC